MRPSWSYFILYPRTQKRIDTVMPCLWNVMIIEKASLELLARSHPLLASSDASARQAKSRQTRVLTLQCFCLTVHLACTSSAGASILFVGRCRPAYSSTKGRAPWGCTRYAKCYPWDESTHLDDWGPILSRTNHRYGLGFSRKDSTASHCSLWNIDNRRPCAGILGACPTNLLYQGLLFPPHY